jgi:hypothetical protein
MLKARKSQRLARFYFAAHVHLTCGIVSHKHHSEAWHWTSGLSFFLHLVGDGFLDFRSNEFSV